MYTKNIFLSLLIALTCISNTQAMHCVAQKLSFNRMQQQARHITGVEVGGIAAFCVVGFFLHTKIAIGNSFDPDFTCNRAPSMKDYYAEVAKIGGINCSRVHENKKSRGCSAFFCRYDGAHALGDAAKKADHTRFLKELDAQKDGRLTHLLLLKKDIDRLRVIEKAANYSLMWAEQSWDQEECQRVLRLTAHVEQCLLHEASIIEEDMPNYIRKKQQEKEQEVQRLKQEMSNFIKKSKSIGEYTPQKLISVPNGNKE
jgi:hypothetical protein